MLDNVGYEQLWKRNLRPGLRAGVVNRFLFNTLGEWGWQRAINRLAAGDAGLTLRQLYRPTTLSRTLLPVARWLYRRPLADPSCNHQDCYCVWCACRAEHA